MKVFEVVGCVCYTLVSAVNDVVLGVLEVLELIYVERLGDELRERYHRRVTFLGAAAGVGFFLGVDASLALI